MTNPYDIGLDQNPANYQPLTPLTFLERAALVFPKHTAIIHGNCGVIMRVSMRGAANLPVCSIVLVWGQVTQCL